MKHKHLDVAIWLCLFAALLALTLFAAPPEGVLAAEGGLLQRSGPALFSGMIVVAALLIVLALVRLLAIPRFTVIPGKLQLFLEQLSCMIDGLARAVRAIGRAFGKIFIGIYKGIRALLRGVAALITGKAARSGPSASARAESGEGDDSMPEPEPPREPMPKQTKIVLVVWLCLIVVLLVLSVLTGHEGHADVQEAMRDAVLHDVNRVDLFGLHVNPGLISAIVVSAALLIAAALIRIFAIPRFKEVPGGFQLALETMVDTLDGLSLSRNGARPTFVGAYVFAAGAYIFVGTLFELLGLQAVAVNGASVTLPAPLSDINAAICMGCQSYLVILGGGLVHAGVHGALATLKEFSLPISMSFRLFGALLSGLLVTDLVYHYITLSYFLPVLIGVMFTLLHALIQTYVLCMLVGMYYGEVSERPPGKRKRRAKPRKQAT